MKYNKSIIKVNKTKKVIRALLSTKTIEEFNKIFFNPKNDINIDEKMLYQESAFKIFQHIVNLEKK